MRATGAKNGAPAESKRKKWPYPHSADRCAAALVVVEYAALRERVG